MSNTDKVSLEVAEHEFGRFVDAMDLDLNTGEMDADDRRDFQQQKGVILRAIQRGHLVINEDGEPVYTPQKLDIDPITFYEPEGATFLEMDRKKKTAEVAKTYAVLGAMTKIGPAPFAKMKNRDMKVCQAIMLCFLA